MFISVVNRNYKGENLFIFSNAHNITGQFLL